MAGPRVISDGGLVPKDPADKIVLRQRWGTRHLAATAQITNSSFTIQSLRPQGDTALTQDNAGIDPSDVNAQTTIVRLLGGTPGTIYRVTNHIVTNESPVQEIERGFLVFVEQH